LSYKHTRAMSLVFLVAAPPTYATFVPGCKWRQNIRLCF